MATPGQFIEQSMVNRFNDETYRREAHKQALSDEERQSKAQLYASNLTNLQQKISSLPKGSPEYNDAFNEMQNNLHGVRELFHPDKNPGMIERYGHLITDALRITNPQDRIKKEAAKRAQGVAGDEKQAQSIVAAAPLSPEQQGTQIGQKQAATDLVAFQSNMKLYDQNHPEGIGPTATPEGKQARNEHVNELLTSGLKEPKEPIDAWTAVKGVDAQKMPDGSYRELQVNKKGEYRYQQMPEGYNPQAAKTKSGTSMFAVSLDTYAKSHGYGSFAEIPDEYKEKVKDYETRKSVLERTISRKSIVTKVMQDAEGHPFTATVTNYSGPAGNEELVGPMPSKEGAAPPSSGPANATPSPAKTNPSSPNLDKVKQAAKALNTPSAGGGNVAYGAPDTSVQMKTPAISKAIDEVREAVGLDSLAKQVAQHPDEAINQKRLAVALERVSAGRFTVQALDYIIKAGWGNTIQGWALSPTTGGLPPDIVRQLVDGAHENLIAKQEALKSVRTPTGEDSGAGKTVKMKAPNGMVKDIPVDQVDHYKGKGAVVIQ